MGKIKSKFTDQTSITEGIEYYRLARRGAPRAPMGTGDKVILPSDKCTLTRDKCTLAQNVSIRITLSPVSLTPHQATSWWEIIHKPQIYSACQW